MAVLTSTDLSGRSALSPGQTVNALYGLFGQLGQVAAASPASLEIRDDGVIIARLLIAEGRLLDVLAPCLASRQVAAVLQRSERLAWRDPDEVVELVDGVTREAHAQAASAGEALARCRLMPREHLRRLWPECLAHKLLAVMAHLKGKTPQVRFRPAEFDSAQLAAWPADVLLAAARLLDTLPPDEADELVSDSEAAHAPAVLLMRTDSIGRVPIPLICRDLGRSLRLDELVQLARLGHQARRAGTGEGAIHLVTLGAGRWAIRIGQYRIAMVRVGGNREGAPPRFPEAELLASDAPALIAMRD